VLLPTEEDLALLVFDVSAACELFVGLQIVGGASPKVEATICA
jgi:hypothetical protein